MKFDEGFEANARLLFYKNYDVCIQDSAKYQLVSVRMAMPAPISSIPVLIYVWARKLVTQMDTLRYRDQHPVAVGNTILQDMITIK